MYEGTIVEESLADNRFLNGLELIGVRITGSEDPAKRWHLWHVRVTRAQASALSGQLAAGTWYAHFWNGNDVIAVFRDKEFSFDHADKGTWQDAVAHGRSLGIPEEQLDFVIDEEN